jgi:deazaflavin-dependent oxidoreductase (nitroreductase family)
VTDPAAISDVASKQVSSHRRHFFVRSRAGGRALSALMLPFALVLPQAGYGVITTVGRRSGRTRRRMIRAIRRDDRAYAVMLRPPIVAIARPTTISAWVLNIRANPEVRLRIRGGNFRGVARELSEPAELERAREAFCETVVPVDYGECCLHLRGMPSRSKIQELHRYWFDTGVPLVIDLR